ncbi:NAD(P)-dependent oxidoreductase [Bradyrhizobium sp. sBnM-33]|uniref:NAD(P)-dependent oxidoreductase n=1 Tax=Bradyrhizobium sp. sBnM-33 TaxID=2831780 RepID=UPI0024BEC3E4|nr:NAD(P)-dependent oxidoreductase [Bradyrhizobium sp. sBnM-33]WOH54475.1 NAD(P)-dependent oxidoreductase [Bradyrhizobium sp. sBnM-33]
MLHGRTIGIIGLGQIGCRIAKHAKGFDMRVLGVRRDKGKPVECVDSVHASMNYTPCLRSVTMS